MIYYEVVVVGLLCWACMWLGSVMRTNSRSRSTSQRGPMLVKQTYRSGLPQVHISGIEHGSAKYAFATGVVPRKSSVFRDDDA